MAILGIVGSADATYLTAEALDPQVSLYCPSGGVVNCTLVTSSLYSRFLGVPVALMGLAWFVVLTVLFVLPRTSRLSALQLPLWFAGMLFVAYLVVVELFVLKAICPYCPVAHAIGGAMGFPILKSTLGAD
jgi:uncharacterized membrane protein